MIKKSNSVYVSAESQYLTQGDPNTWKYLDISFINSSVCCSMVHHILQHYQARVVFIVVVRGNKTAAEFQVDTPFNQKPDIYIFSDI